MRHLACLEGLISSVGNANASMALMSLKNHVPVAAIKEAGP